MPNLFGVDMRSLFATNMADKLYDSTLSKVTPGAYNPADPTAGNASTSTAYPCKGVATKVISDFIKDDLVRRIEGEVLILLGTLPADIQPRAGDVITTVFPGMSTATVVGTVYKVVVDPAGASAVCSVHA